MLSIAEVSLVVFFGTTIIVTIPIIIWLFRDLRRIGPVRSAPRIGEEVPRTSGPDDYESQYRARPVPTRGSCGREVKASPPRQEQPTREEREGSRA
jgi:hypothetical protein